MARLASDEREHRRGLVLGLTMAEVLLLLLFLLLLALAARLSQQATKLRETESIVSTLEPVLKAAAGEGQLTPSQVQGLAKDLADAARLRQEMGAVKSQLADAAKKLETFKQLESQATAINPNDPPASTLRKGLERVTPQFESSLAEWRKRSDTLSQLEKQAQAIDATAPLVTTLSNALGQMRETQDSRANAQLGGRIRQQVAVLRETEQRLSERLEGAMGSKLKEWNAKFDPKTLTLRFADPNMLFEVGSAKLRPTFEALLSQLVPEYLKVLHEFKNDIEEVRIEGHTSSEWGTEKGLYAYFNNMALSQERTRAVLEYGLTKTNTPEPVVQWGRERITANGLSSSRPRELASGVEDPDASRRVEFRVLMKAKEQLLQIIEPGAK
jgi:outer membrane protein OmpA-like peptidoglycan-associated protein